MNKKLIYGGLTVAGIGAAAYLLFNKKTGVLSKKESTVVINPVQQDYLTMANNIQDAMDGYGTNEDVIFNELNKLKTKEDWNALVSAYGIREIGSGRLNIFQSDFSGGLIQSLKSELSSKDIIKANQILNKLGVSI
jgi:hypothetical protein